jgi:hypothetical protein
MAKWFKWLFEAKQDRKDRLWVQRLYPFVNDKIAVTLVRDFRLDRSTAVFKKEISDLLEEMGEPIELELVKSVERTSEWIADRAVLDRTMASSRELYAKLLAEHGNEPNDDYVVAGWRAFVDGYDKHVAGPPNRLKKLPAPAPKFVDEARELLQRLKSRGFPADGYDDIGMRIFAAGFEANTESINIDAGHTVMLDLRRAGVTVPAGNEALWAAMIAVSLNNNATANDA